MSKYYPSINSGSLKVGTTAVTGALNDLSDIANIGLTIGQLLAYNGTKWYNTSALNVTGNVVKTVNNTLDNGSGGALIKAGLSSGAIDSYATDFKLGITDTSRGAYSSNSGLHGRAMVQDGPDANGNTYLHINYGSDFAGGVQLDGRVFTNKNLLDDLSGNATIAGLLAVPNTAGGATSLLLASRSGGSYNALDFSTYATVASSQPNTAGMQVTARLVIQDDSGYSGNMLLQTKSHNATSAAGALATRLSILGTGVINTGTGTTLDDSSGNMNVVGNLTANSNLLLGPSSTRVTMSTSLLTTARSNTQTGSTSSSSGYGSYITLMTWTAPPDYTVSACTGVTLTLTYQNVGTSSGSNFNVSFGSLTSSVPAATGGNGVTVTNTVTFTGAQFNSANSIGAGGTLTLQMQNPNGSVSGSATVAFNYNVYNPLVNANGGLYTKYSCMDDGIGNFRINNGTGGGNGSTINMDISTYGGATPGFRWQAQDQGGYLDSLTLYQNKSGTNNGAMSSVFAIDTTGATKFNYPSNGNCGITIGVVPNGNYGGLLINAPTGSNGYPFIVQNNGVQAFYVQNNGTVVTTKSVLDDGNGSMTLNNSTGANGMLKINQNKSGNECSMAFCPTNTTNWFVGPGVGGNGIQNFGFWNNTSNSTVFQVNPNAVQANVPIVVTTAGSASSPSICWSQSLGEGGGAGPGGDTGLYWISDGVFGLTSNGTLRLQVNGSGVQVIGTFTNSSDISKKTNVERLDCSATDIIMQLEPVTYNWTVESGAGDPNVTQHGFIAQEVQRVLPEIVSEDDDGLLHMSYISLISILVKSHQELTGVNQQLQVDNQQLRDRLARIERLLQL